MEDEGETQLWNVSIERELASILVDFKEAGLLVRGKCPERNTWNSIAQCMTQTTGREYSAINVRGKVARLRRLVADFTTLLGTDGFHWDAMSNTVTASDEKWMTYSTINARAIRFRYRGCPNYTTLAYAFN